jgi:hypothetical protein
MANPGKARKLLDRRAWFVLVAVAAALLTLWSLGGLFTGRMLAGHRPEYHALRVLLVADIWRSGEIIPRWVPELAGGLGYPLFIYYGWLSYAFAAELHVLGMSPVAAVNAVTVAALLWQAAGAWQLGRALGGRAGGYVAWALFAFAPYQLVNVWVRGNYPELVAGSFAPWALWAMYRTVTGRGRFALPACATLLAAIVLCHNISGLTLGATVVFAGLVFASTLPPGMRRGAAGRALLAAAAGVLLAACFWLPILAGRGDVNLASDFNAYLDYRQHFLSPRQLVATGWGYGFSLPGPQDTMPLQLGIVQVATLLCLGPLAIGLARRSAPRRRVRLALFVGAGLGLAFLTTAWSAALWAVFPPLWVLQFPWRLHLPATLVVAVTGALATRVLATARWRRVRWLRLEALLAAVAALAVAATSLPYCRALTSYDCDERCLRRALARGYYTTSINDEFRPVGATDLGALGRLMLSGQVTLDGAPLPDVRLPSPPHRGRFTLHAQLGHAGELRLPLFWFPGWRATIDGVAQPTYACAGTGTLCLRVPAGAHGIAAAWRPTLVYRIGEAISFLTAVGLAWTARKRRRQPPAAAVA